MKASDIATLPIAAGAALRNRRLFHPAGVLASGVIERLAPPQEGLPIESGEIVGRISKALGTPGPLPDAAGLAWRMAPAPFAASSWDVLLVTAGIGSASWVPDRMMLRPVTSWSNATYTSLLPLSHNDGLWWIRARTTTRIDSHGLALSTVEGLIERGLEFEIDQASGTADFEPLARLTLNAMIPTDDDHGHDIDFDPVQHTAQDVQIWPDWLRQLRQSAYRNSREGRDED